MANRPSVLLHDHRMGRRGLASNFKYWLNIPAPENGSGKNGDSIDDLAHPDGLRNKPCSTHDPYDEHMTRSSPEETMIEEPGETMNEQGDSVFGHPVPGFPSSDASNPAHSTESLGDVKNNTDDAHKAALCRLGHAMWRMVHEGGDDDPGAVDEFVRCCSVDFRKKPWVSGKQEHDAHQWLLGLHSLVIHAYSGEKPFTQVKEEIIRWVIKSSSSGAASPSSLGGAPAPAVADGSSSSVGVPLLSCETLYAELTR